MGIEVQMLRLRFAALSMTPRSRAPALVMLSVAKHLIAYLVQIHACVATQDALFRRQHWRLGGAGVEVGEFSAAVVVD